MDEVKDEMMDVLHKVWFKLQNLPQANPLELGAFAIVLLFVGTFLFMVVLSCSSCCCCGKRKYHPARVDPV